MSNGHNNVKRLVRRAAEELKSSIAIGGVCGVSEGVNAFRAKFDLQVMNRNGYEEPPAVRSRLVRKHEAVMTYLDLIVMAQRRSKSIADAFADIEPNNPQCDELFRVLGKPCDEKKWATLSVSTDLFKLTWRQEYLKQVGGAETFYGRILKGAL